MGRKKIKIPKARTSALDCLELTERGMDLQGAIDLTLSKQELDIRDQRLVTELSYGYFRYFGRLFFLLSRFMTRKKSLPVKVRRALVLAGYEICFLDKIPAYASVNWAVEYIQSHFGGGLGKMANAILRKLDGTRESMDDEDLYASGSTPRTKFLSRYFSCPEWIVRLWLEQYTQEQTRLLLEASLQEPPLGLRVNIGHSQSKTAFKTLQKEKIVNSFSTGAALASKPSALAEMISSGLVSRQSGSVQEAMNACVPGQWPGPVWDNCCGRGGKTFFLTEQGIGPVWSSDQDFRRLQGLLSESRRLHLPAIVFSADGRSQPPLKKAPQTILLDVPCSGLGVLSRRPDVKWKRQPGDIRSLTSTQERLLSRAWSTLPRGGNCIYMTCTINRQENEAIIDSLRHNHPEAKEISRFQTPFASPLKEFFYCIRLQKA